MNIAAWVDGYPPNYKTGASMMLHEILVGLQSRGHSAHVYDLKLGSSMWDGIEVTALRAGVERQAYDWADIVITQGTASGSAFHHFSARCPIAYINHDPRDFRTEAPPYSDKLMVIFNTQYGQAAINYPFRSTVVLPPVHPERYQTLPGDAVTLINLNQNKGAPIFWQLALMFPNRQFLGVKGSYGHQIVPREIPQNVRIMETTSDMKSVYSQTRVLLMPSARESYGRVAVEACASGIPVITSDTAGLREAMSDAGIFVASKRVEDWAEALTQLDDEGAYASASARCLARSAALDPSVALDALSHELEMFVQSFRKM